MGLEIEDNPLSYLIFDWVYVLKPMLLDQSQYKIWNML